MEEVPRLIVRTGGWVPHELEEHRTNDATDFKHYSNRGSLLSYLDFYNLYLYNVANQIFVLNMTHFTSEKTVSHIPSLNE